MRSTNRSRSGHPDRRQRSALQSLALAGLLLLVLSAITPRAAIAEDVTLLLDVQTNGHSVGKIAEFTSRNGVLMARLTELHDIGITTPARFDGGADRLIALSDLPGLSWRVDEQTQTIYLTASSERTTATVLRVGDGNDGGRIIGSGTGITANYDMVDTFNGHRNSLNGETDLRAFSPLGVASSAFLVLAGRPATNTQSRVPFVRLDSTYTFADATHLRRFSAGDFINGSLSWTRPVRLTGLQIRTDLTMRPDLITFPLPTITGSASVPSTVDILANGNLVLSHQIDAGPFQVPQLPVVTGAGTVSLNVTNALGQQQTVNQSFYASAALLSPGLQAFSAQAGFVRLNWGAISNDFGSLAASGTYRRGLNSNVTVEATTETTGQGLMAGGGLVLNAANLGVVNFALAGSGGGGSGTRFVFGMQRIAQRLSMGASAIFATSHFHDLASQNGNPIPKQQISANLGLSFTKFGSLGVAYAGIDLVSAPRSSALDASQPEHSHVVSASYTLQLRRYSLTATDFRDFSNNSKSGVVFGIAIPLHKRATVSAAMSSSGAVQQFEMQRSVTSVGDWGYQAFLSGGDSQHAFVEVQHKSVNSLVSFGLDHTANQTVAVAESQGSLSLIDHALFPANFITDSFAIVDTSGLAHVHVQQENREVGTTNGHGRLLVPDLRSYDLNHLSIQANDIPLDSSIENPVQEVRPQDHSGLVVHFPIRLSHGAIVRLTDENGADLPLSSVITLLATQGRFPVGYDGQAYLQDLQNHNVVTVTIGGGGGHCSVAFDYRALPGEIPVIGPLTCKESR